MMRSEDWLKIRELFSPYDRNEDVRWVMKEMNNVKQMLLNTGKTELMIVLIFCVFRLIVNQYALGFLYCLVLLTVVNFILCVSSLFEKWEEDRKNSKRSGCPMTVEI